jgi:hypothetical protein
MKTYSKPSYMLTAKQLNATVDATGIVNLAALFDLCVAQMHKIENARAGSGRRTNRSMGRLGRHVGEFLISRGYSAASFANWFNDQPRQQFLLEINEED